MPPNWWLNFYLSPRYEGVLPRRDHEEALSKIPRASIRRKAKLELRSQMWPSRSCAKRRSGRGRPTPSRAALQRIVEVSDGRKHAIHYTIAEDTA